MMPTEILSNRRSLTLLAALAGIFLFFGIGQFQVLQHHKKIASESDRLLFKFTTIREFITGALLEERYGDLSAAAGELESFGDHVADILKNPLIPDSYKAGLIRQADLPGTVLLARQIAGSGGQGKISQLNERIRQLGDQLLLFDRMISSHIKKKVVGYQSLVIGVLVIVLVALGNFFFFHYRDVIRPLIHFRRKMGAAEPAEGAGDRSGSGADWVGGLCRRVMAMAEREADSQAELHRLKAMVKEGGGAGPAMLQMGRLTLVGQMASGVCHEVSDAANCIINHSQLCLDEVGDCANAEGLRVMLRRLLDDGERVAAIAGHFLKVSQDRDAAGPTAAPERVIAEISSLVSGQFRQDGIRFSCAGKGRAAAIACPPPVFRLLCLQLVLLGRTWLKHCVSVSAADNPLVELICGEEYETGRDGFSLLTITWSVDSGALSGLVNRTEKNDSRIEEGLALCRAIVESEHGELAVDRARPGTVTVFCRLPLAG